jgi:hypothetical protein
MDKIQKPSNSECHTLSSEPFRVYHRRMFLWNICIHLQDYTMSRPRRPQSEKLTLWKHRNFNVTSHHRRLQFLFPSWSCSPSFYVVKWDSSVGIAMGCGLDDRGSISNRAKRFFVFSTASRLALEPTLPPIQWLLGALPPGVKWPGHEADHSSPSSAKVNNGGALPPLPHVFIGWWLMN